MGGWVGGVQHKFLKTGWGMGAGGGVLFISFSGSQIHIIYSYS